MPENRDEELLSGLQEELRKRPELEGAASLYQELIAARSEVRPKVTPIQPEQRHVDELLDQRTPLLCHWDLEWDEESFIRLGVRVCEITARHRQDLASQFEDIRALLTEDSEQTRKLVTSYLRETTVEVPGRPELDPDLLSFVLNNALRPFVGAYAAALPPSIKDEKWYQRVCPICGGEPDFGYLEETVGGLRLLCSRCDTVWTYKRGECTFCANSDQETFAYYLSDDEAYRLYTCDRCRRYLKVMDGRQTASKTLLPLQRLVTIGMDVAARQEGYH